jgi:hypothetical protein
MTKQEKSARVEQVYQDLCEHSYDLRQAMNNAFSDEIDAILWTCAKQQVESDEEATA